MIDAMSAPPPREMMVSPADLFASQQSAAECDARWWVLHTRSRAEKAIGQQLAGQDVPYFLPLYQRRRKVQRRIVQTQIPLFPGYLFLLGDEEARQAALDTRLVANCLPVDDQSSLVRDLQSVLTLIESGTPLAPESRLQPGMPARIVHGAMAGIEGVVVRRNSGQRFVVAVDFLQQGAGVDIDDYMLEPI